MPSPRRKRKAGEGLRRGGDPQPTVVNAGARPDGARDIRSLREIVKRRLAKIAIPPLSLLPEMPTFAPSLSNDGDERRLVEETSMRQAEAQ